MVEEEKKAEKKKAGAGGEEGGKAAAVAGVGEKEDAGKEEVEGGGDGEDQKETLPPPPPPPPPEEIVLRVYMHCEGCARKVRRSLKGFEGVEDVTADCRTQRVVVKGRAAAADPLVVVHRVEKKSGRKVELLTPIPPKPAEKAADEKKEEEKAKPKSDEKKEEPPVAMRVVLKVHMHCEACSQEMKKRILKMKGVQAADADLNSSKVTVEGVFEPPKLVEFIYRRTGKHAVMVTAEAAGKKAEEKSKEEKKADGGADGDKEKAASAGGHKEGGGGGEEEKSTAGDSGNVEKEGGGVAGDAAAAAKLGEMTKNPLCYQYPRYQVEYAYAPQIFSDDNPNACSVM